MEIIFPDVPEYQFILKALYSDKLALFPKFHCEAVTDFESELTADVAFVPAPIAIINSKNYMLLRTGNIFSYFTGPQIFRSQEGSDEIFVSEKDFVSEHYVKILLNGVRTRKGTGFPSIMEPRIALLSEERGHPKVDLYATWRKIADDLPFPLYVGIIRKSLKNLREIVEEAINASIKYGLNNASSIISDIAVTNGIENVEMLMRVMFQFINKNTFSISEEEVEALKALNREMESRGFTVSSLKI